MDKDSKLIFESYKNRVVLNEYAKALGGPALAGLDAVLSWIGGLAVTGVVLDQANKMLQKIPEIKRKAFEEEINEVSRLLSLNPEEIRSHYELINYIKKKGNPLLSKLADNFKEPIEIYRMDQENVSVGADTYLAVLTSSIQAHQELLNSQDAIDREIDKVVSQSDLADVEKERIKAETKVKLAEAKNRKLELENEKIRLENERQKGGGGGDKDPNKKGKGGIIAGITGGISIVGLILKTLSDNYKALKTIFWAAIILSPAFGLYIISLLFGSAKEYGEAATKFGDELKRELEKPKAKPSPTPPSSKWVPEKPSLPKQSSTPAPQAEPTPFPFKRK